MKFIAFLTVTLLSGCSVLSVANSKSTPTQAACASGSAKAADALLFVATGVLTAVSIASLASDDDLLGFEHTGGMIGTLVFAPLSLGFGGSLIYGATREGCGDSSSTTAAKPSLSRTHSDTDAANQQELDEICRDYELATGRRCR